MSLVVALHASADHYGLAADTRIVTHIVHMARTAPKTFTSGDWFGGWSGTMAVGQALIRELGDLGSTRDTAEAALLGAWARVLATHGLRPSDQSPFIDVDELLVGPPGIVRLSANSALVWSEGVGVTGCADEYVTGWLDRDDGEAPIADRLHRVMAAAAARYPGVGAPFDVHTIDRDHAPIC